MPVNPVISARIVAALENGDGQRATSRRFNVSLSTVQRTYQRYQETGLLTRRAGSGRKKATTARDDRFIVLTSLRNRTLTAVNIRNHLHEVRNINISEWTVRRRLHSAELSSRTRATGPPLTRAHRVARLNFAREHLAWNLEDWSRVLFSDESRFCLTGSDRRVRVWRRRNERYAQACIAERLPFGGGSVMVWAGISSEAHTELVFVANGALNAHRYIEEILQDHVVPYMAFLGDGAVYMQDNARPHVARIVSAYLNEVQIERLNWPPRSPDLNPIEHLWDEMGRRVRRHIPAPRNAQELRNLLLQVWEDIPQNTITNLIESMPRRMRAVINARGGNTRY